MWSAKFRVFDKQGIYSTRTRKFNLTIYGYALNYYSDKKYFYYVATGILIGKENSKKEFILDLKKDKRTNKIEYNSDFFICVTKESINNENKRFVKLFYNPLIIHPKPTIIDSQGYETNYVCCFDRKYIEDLIKVSRKLYNLKLFYIKKENIKNIGILNVLPNLTEKQKQVISFANSEGYYQYPRKTDIKTLAKKFKLSFSTFQEHLRRAENKLLPTNIKKL